MTPIEHLVGRRLEREERAGVTHFRTGQHQARRLEAAVCDRHDLPLGLYELSYVDVMGYACLVLVAGHGGWTPLAACRGGQFDVRRSTPPTLSKRMVAALQEARSR